MLTRNFNLLLKEFEFRKCENEIRLHNIVDLHSRFCSSGTLWVNDTISVGKWDNLSNKRRAKLTSFNIFVVVSLRKTTKTAYKNGVLVTNQIII